jgi:uncharacterized protein
MTPTMNEIAATLPGQLDKRFLRIDWSAFGTTLDAQGHATIPGLLTLPECVSLAQLYEDEALFRRRIVMERHAYGVGEYKYFAYPLPPLVAELRHRLYRRLAPLANAWAAHLAGKSKYPPELGAFLDHCHAGGQTKPTPLLLRYETGGFNCLHQDLYGAIAFPLQATILLSKPGADFTGGEFLLIEQRPRAQSRGAVVVLAQGDAVIFANAYRPVAGKRGTYRVNLRHGVSTVLTGRRATLGIIFHDAA